MQTNVKIKTKQTTTFKTPKQNQPNKKIQQKYKIAKQHK